ncbi:MAG: dihydroorotase [Saprospiraceae bacterium]|jgi:dihydroorotase
MNRILIKKARIYDQNSNQYLKIRDILIENGKIVDIKARIQPSGKFETIESKQLCISPGWVDIGAFNGEPGKEQREDLKSLRNAAAHGGYVAIAPFPTGQPTTDSKGQIAYLKSKNHESAVQIYPIGALTMDRNGRDMAELIDLSAAGAIAFSDGQGSKMGEGQIQRSLLYLKGIDSNLIYVVNAKKPGEEGQVNEGEVSVSMGVEGIPAHQEKVAVNTVLRQVEYTGSRALIHNISLGWAADKIAKNALNHKVAASVPYLNLAHNEEDVKDFNNNFKLLPPLRQESERKKLCKAVEKGRVDIITSNHSPKTVEEKDEPFGLSPFGASSIETTFSGLVTHTKDLSLERIVNALSIGPRKALGLEKGSIKIGEMASITLFDPEMSWQVSERNLLSKSKNNPYIGKELKGCVIGILNNSKLIKTKNL